jgi:hypothetical protein
MTAHRRSQARGDLWDKTAAAGVYKRVWGVGRAGAQGFGGKQAGASPSRLCGVLHVLHDSVGLMVHFGNPQWTHIG